MRRIVAGSLRAPVATQAEYMGLVARLVQSPLENEGEWTPSRNQPIPLTFLQRSQEVEKVLLLLCFQFTEMFDDGVCLAAFALVSVDRLQQIAGPSVMKEKDTLPYTPKRSGSELVRTGAALRD